MFKNQNKKGEKKIMKKGAISLISALGGAALGAAGVNKAISKQINDRQKMSDKHFALFQMMNQWVKVKQEGKNLSSYLEEKGYKKVAIYGMSYAGETFVEELKGTNVEAAYGIDKNADNIYADIDVFSMEDSLPEADAVVVTAITFFDEIEEKLSVKLDCPIISLEDILYEV